VAAPSLAGIINNARTPDVSTDAENALIYANLGNANNFTDITSGSCGTNSATTGYDLCTGVGVVNGFAIRYPQTITFSEIRIIRSAFRHSPSRPRSRRGSA
jgi:hypothetical protein